MIGALGVAGDSPHDEQSLWLGRYLAPAAYAAPPPTRRWNFARAPFTYLGNDRVGCCTRTVIGHALQLYAHLRGRTLTLTDADVLTAYRAGTSWDGVPGSGSDRGDLMLHALVQAVQQGIGGYKLGGFVRLNPYDPVELNAAINLFGGVVVCTALPRRIRDQPFVWRLPEPEAREAEDAPRSLGGHAWLLHGYDRGSFYGHPWTREIEQERRHHTYYVTEAWAIWHDLWIDPGAGALNGFDAARLRADFAALALD